MGQTVTRTFDILQLALNEFPREDALGGKRDGKWYTFSTEEYNKKSHQFAFGLMALGLKKGDKVATVTTNRPEWNFVDMGMTQAGMIHVPVYPTIGSDEYEYIFSFHCLISKSRLIYQISSFVYSFYLLLKSNCCNW